MPGHRNHLRFERGERHPFEKRDDEGPARSPGITGTGVGSRQGPRPSHRNTCTQRHREASGVELQPSAPSLGMSRQRPQSCELAHTPPFPDFVLRAADRVLPGPGAKDSQGQQTAGM